MTTLATRLWGDVVISGDGAYVPYEADENGRTRRPSLYIAADASDFSLVDDVHALDVRARAALVEALERADTVVVDFIVFHREELEPEIARVLLGDATTPSDTIARLDLVGIGIRADAFVLDYSFGKPHTDQLLVVAFGSAGQLLRIAHES